MAFISRATIDEVNSRMDAIAVVNDYVRLEKRGGRWWGLCPFHNEKTGSFTVNPDLKTYYCFGCHKGGSVLNFVMEMDKLNFPEAVELLAKRTGVEIVYDNSGGPDTAENEERKRKKEQLYELYRRMAGTFQHFLLKNPEGQAAKRYIVERGLSDLIIERFRLGYAPADRRWLFGFLQKKGYSKDFLASSGLFSARYPGVPLFAGRLMFPIADRQGRVVAFGGRVLPGVADTDGREPPKYINSPEIEIYKKGETLFAVDLAIPEIRRTKTVYICEGYMDAIALHQAGIANAVAPLGTAFTDEQARLLHRWAEKAILVFDSDNAGQTAAVKGILTCRKNGLTCAVVVPGGEGTADAAALKDPADILKEFGPETLKKKSECYINDFEYLIARAKSLYLTGNDAGTSEGKAGAVAFLFPYLEALDSEVSRDACIETAAAAFGTVKTAILNDLRQNAARRSGTGGQGSKFSKEEQAGLHTGGQPASGARKPIKMNDELFLLMTAAVNDTGGGQERLYPLLRKSLRINEIDDPAAKELFVALEECFVNDETGADQFLARIADPELRDFYLKRGSSKEFTMNSARLLEDGIKKVVKKRLERRLDEIVARLAGLEKNALSGAAGEADELLAEKIHIDETLRQT
jgi:DNA primase